MASVVVMTAWLMAAQEPAAAPEQAAPAPAAESPAAAPPAAETPATAETPAAAETPAPAAQSAAATPAPAEGAATQPPPPPPKEKAMKKVDKPKPPRAWWSTWGIVAGLAVSAVAAVVFVGGVATQVLAFYFWVDQTNANRRYDERQFATSRARAVQWIALGLLGGGIAAFFGGLIGATYAFGLGNPDPKSAKDL